MIPTKTLKQRMTEALDRALVEARTMGGRRDHLKDVSHLVDAAVQALEDPCLIKTADSLEPTFTLRAQDLSADRLVEQWACMAQAAKAGLITKGQGPSGIGQEKIDEALNCAAAMRQWPNRKWPD